MLRPATVSENLLFSTVRIETKKKNGKNGFATGFFFDYKIKDKKILPLIITNKHVVKDTVIGRFYVHEGRRDKDILVPSENSFDITINNFEKIWYFHPDKDVDLCAMPFNGIRKSAEKEEGKLIFNRVIDETLLLSDKELENLSAVEDILMVGYPIGLWDKQNNLPIIRRGITASHPAIDFNGKSRGIIDAACFPGSSGSPVLIVNEQGYVTKNGGSVYGSSRAIFLGVQFAAPARTAKGEIVEEEIPTELESIVKTKQMIHLGYIVKAKEIIVLGDYITRAVPIT
jgi:hypothetical protein